MVMMMMMDDSTVLQEGKYWALLSRRRKREENRPKKLSEQDKKKRIKEWCTLYRRNMNLYATERLKIKLRPFQHIMLYMMNVSDVFWCICSRGCGKSWLVGLAAVCRCLMFPYSEVVIVSSTIDQANKIVDQKIDRDIIGKLSPVLKWMKEEPAPPNIFDNTKMIEIKHPKDCAVVEFWNGSWIRVMPALDSSRGERATFLIAEEARLIKKSIWISVFTKMAHPRQAEFLNLPEYQGRTELLEECKEVYITSAWFKSNWIWKSFKDCVEKCYNDRTLNYSFYAADIFVAIKHGLKTIADYKKGKQDGELEHRIEDLNEMVGEADGAYFTLEMLQKNQILTKALRPPTNAEFNAGVDHKNRKKKANEYRMLAVDLAFTENAEGKSEEADRCALAVICVICRQDGMVVRNLEYLDSMSGGDDKAVQQRIRELYWDLDIDYIIFDVNSGGENYFNSLTTPWHHPERLDWNPHGFGLCNELDLQFVAQGKINEYRQRTVDPEAIPCLIPMRATTELNSNMWKSLWKAWNNGTLRLLEDELQVEKKMDDAKYALMTSEEKMLFKNPYVQTSMLISEAINLSQTWRNGTLTLTQPRSGHKDRCSAVQYGNALADKIENKYAISQHQDDVNIDDYLQNLVF